MCLIVIRLSTLRIPEVEKEPKRFRRDHYYEKEPFVRIVKVKVFVYFYC